MGFEKCNICHEYHWSYQKCDPIYYFKHEYWGDDFQEIRAFDHEDAALKFAEKINEGSGDYVLMDGGEETVIISNGTEEKTFSVSAEPSIDYHAVEISTDQKGN